MTVDVLVSVILPSLNSAPFIRETLASVTRQTLKEIEILCVDAGSTDGTVEIIEEYAAADERVRLMHSDRKSYGYQMNLGIREARGAYIGIVETDDYVDPQMYEVLYRTAREQDADIVKSDFDMFLTGADGRRYFVPYSLRLMNGVSYGEVYSCEAYRSRRVRVECAIWNAIYKKEFLVNEEIRFQETPGASFQDFGFKYQAAFLAKRIVAVPESFYRYRRDHGESSTYSARTPAFNLQEAKFLLERFSGEWTKDVQLQKALYGDILMYASWPLMELLRWGYPADGTMEVYASYRDILRQALLDNRIIKGESDPGLWFDLQLILEGPEVFVGYAKVLAHQDAARIRSFFHETQRAQDLVIFGSGRLGHEAQVWLMKNGADNLRAFVDNKESLQGQDADGIPVLSPAEAQRRFPEALFLIAARSDTAAAQVDEQLQSMGIPVERRLRYFHALDPFFCTNTVERDMPWT